MNINYESVVNSLSMGQVSVNLLREFNKRDMGVSFFPISDQLDFTAFNKTSGDFQKWVIKSAQEHLSTFNYENPSLKLWHISGSEKSVNAKNNFLYTFYETSEPTQQEINIVRSYKHVFFSSRCAVQYFIKAGCNNVSFVPLGFDPDFGPTGKKYLEGVIHFGLMGKFEDRKNTKLIIQSWLEKYGDNPKYQLTLLVNNPFFNQEDFNKIIVDSVKGRMWKNLNILNPLKTNEEINEIHNAIDIDLSGLSSSEGWGIPAFTSCCLGKVVVVTDYSAHKDWATGINTIKVEPSGERQCYDGVFFKKGSPFNQGSFARISKESIIDGMERAVKLHESYGNFGVREDMIESFSYKRTVDDLFNVIYKK